MLRDTVFERARLGGGRRRQVRGNLQTARRGEICWRVATLATDGKEVQARGVEGGTVALPLRILWGIAMWERAAGASEGLCAPPAEPSVIQR